MDKKFYIHIGMPKAASTSLQKNLFDYLPSFHHIGNSHQNSAIDQQVKTIIHSIIGCEQSEYNKKEVYRLLSNKVNAINEKRILLSDESFAMGYSRFPGQVEKFEIARRLKTLFPDAKILLIIRNQATMLQSLYAQKLKNSVNLPTWQEWLKEQKSYSHLTSQFSWLKYDKIYETYSYFFGEDNITISLYEDLISEPLRFYSNLKLFFDNCIDISTIEKCLSSSQSRNQRTTNYKIKLNKIAKYKRLKSITNLIPVTVRKKVNNWANQRVNSINLEYNEEDISFIQEFYSESNARMSKLLNFDLTKQEYPM